MYHNPSQFNMNGMQRKMVPRARFELAAKEISCRIDEHYIHNPQCFCKLRTHPQLLPGYTIEAQTCINQPSLTLLSKTNFDQATNKCKLDNI